jgi:hypothetical protein
LGCGGTQRCMPLDAGSLLLSVPPVNDGGAETGSAADIASVAGPMPWRRAGHRQHRQRPYEGEHARHGEAGRSQQHDPPAWHAHPTITGRSRPSAGRRPWMGFSAPVRAADHTTKEIAEFRLEVARTCVIHSHHMLTIPRPRRGIRRRSGGAAVRGARAGPTAPAPRQAQAAASAAVGATTPFSVYEAEVGTPGGGAAVRSLTSAPTTRYSGAALEASGHAYVHPGVGVHPNVHRSVQPKAHHFLRASSRWGRRGHPLRQDAGQEPPSRAPYGRRHAMGLRPTLDRGPCPGGGWLSGGPGALEYGALCTFACTGWCTHK